MKKIIIILIAVLVCFGIYYKFIKKDVAEKTRTVYKYGDVEKGTIEIKILATGSIKPFNQVDIKATSRGRIEEVFVQEGDIVNIGTVLATISSEDRNAILDAALSQIKLAKASGDRNALNEAQQAYEIAQSAYKPVFLTSTIEGEIINRSCEPGQNVDLSNVLFVVSDKLVARVDVDEVDIAKMRKGLKAYITLDSYPDQIVNGKISKISREGKTVSSVVVYEILVEPDTVPEKWASGMTANIEFVTQSKNNIIVCPKSAVKEDSGEVYVMINEKHKGNRSEGGNVPVRRVIKTGIDDGRLVEITYGLELGERVVIETTQVSEKNNNGNMFMGPRRRRN